MINKANVTGELKIEGSVEIEPLGATKEKHLVAVTTSGANKVEFLCSEVKNSVGVVTAKVITGTSNVSGCVTFINGKAEPNCNPLNQPIAGGGKAEAVLFEGKPYGKAEGVAGVFATVKFNEETCLALSPSVKITGVAWGEDCNNEGEVEKVTHLVQEAKLPAEKLGGLFFGSNKATVIGSANVALSGAHKGMTFSGLAE